MRQLDFVNGPTVHLIFRPTLKNTVCACAQILYEPATTAVKTEKHYTSGCVHEALKRF